MKENNIVLKYKFSLKNNNQSLIHNDLIKMEASYKLNRIFCLIDHMIWVFNFDSTTLIESRLPYVYINDFSISDDFMIIGSETSSGNEALKYVFLENQCHYNHFGEPERGKMIWATGTHYRHNLKRAKNIKFKDRLPEVQYVKFLPNNHQFIAFSCGILYKINEKGEILSSIAINDLYFPFRHNRSRKIDMNEKYIFIAVENEINIYNIENFTLIKQISFKEKINIIKPLKNMDYIVILIDGTIYSSKNGLMKKLVKINKEIVSFDFDEINLIYYFGNSKGEFFAINEKAEIVLDKILDESIRDILILNNGEHILLGGKERYFFLFENENCINILDNNEKMKFNKGLNNGMKKIFLSYSHQDSDLANFIDTTLLNKGIQLIRDIRDIRYRQSIKEFMKSIRKTDYVFIIISEKYLQSSACMYEVLELIKDENYNERIIPIIRDNAKIFNIDGRAKYIEYWQNEYNKAKKESKKINILNSTYYIENLKKIESIQRNLPEFLEIISDMNSIICKKNKLTDKEIKLIIDIINS